MRYPFDIEFFEKRFPILFSHFDFTTFKEFERTNIQWLTDDAMKCNIQATAKIIFYNKEALKRTFVQEKILKLSKLHTTGEESEKKWAKSGLRKINNAFLDIYPEAGRPTSNLIRMEKELFIEEYIRTVIEIQETRKVIGDDVCSKKDWDKLKDILFLRNSKFLEAVKDMRVRLEERIGERDELRNSTEKDVKKAMERAEKLLLSEICAVLPTQLARDILAQEYGVDSDSIKTRIPRGISKDLNDKHPNIPNNPNFIKTMITEGLKRREKAQEERKRRKDQQRLL